MGDADNIVISRPGKDATNPALADADKIFDSDWAFGGAIIAMGTQVLPTNEGVGGTHSFSFPDAGFAPSAIVFGVRLPSMYYGLGGANVPPTLVISGEPFKAQFRSKASPSDRYRYFPRVTNNRVILNDWLPRASYDWETTPCRYSTGSSTYYYTVGYVIFAF
jgi:hypothetical protein